MKLSGAGLGAHIEDQQCYALGVSCKGHNADEASLAATAAESVKGRILLVIAADLAGIFLGGAQLLRTHPSRHFVTIPLSIGKAPRQFEPSKVASGANYGSVANDFTDGQ